MIDVTIYTRAVELLKEREKMRNIETLYET